MQQQNNSKPPIDEALFQRIKAQKQIQGFAWKIERAIEIGGEACEIVRVLVEKYAGLIGVHEYFPDMRDVFTPEAIFCIEYAHHKATGGQMVDRYNNHAVRVRDVLIDISNRVVRHEITVGQLKRVFNSHVNRWSETREVLPLFDFGEVEDGRVARNKTLFVPSAAPIKDTLTSKYNAEDFKEGDTITIEPRESFSDGDVVILESVGGGNCRAVYLYNATRKNAHGQPYKYFYNTRKQSSI